MLNMYIYWCWLMQLLYLSLMQVIPYCAAVNFAYGSGALVFSSFCCIEVFDEVKEK
jgi:hypothetical protein